MIWCSIIYQIQATILPKAAQLPLARPTTMKPESLNPKADFRRAFSLR
jgi:hypothetical protein